MSTNDKLAEECSNILATMAGLVQRTERLRRDHDALLAALKECVEVIELRVVGGGRHVVLDKARAAIERASGP